MGWSGGVFTQTDGTFTGSGICQSQAGDGDPKIKATEMDALLEDHAAGINACLNKDGSNAATGNLDLGSNKITGLAEGTATGDAGRWNEDLASLSLVGTVLTATFNDGSTTGIDIASVASASEMTLTTDQTASGKKTFTGDIVVDSVLKVQDYTAWDCAYNASTPSNITHFCAVTSRRFIRNTGAFSLFLNTPVYAADTDLGNEYVLSGAIGFRNETGHGAVTVSCGNATYSQEIGQRPTTSGAMYSLVYQIYYANSAVHAIWTWVSP